VVVADDDIRVRQRHATVGCDLRDDSRQGEGLLKRRWGRDGSWITSLSASRSMQDHDHDRSRDTCRPNGEATHDLRIGD
jgi:hypothetical protein